MSKPAPRRRGRRRTWRSRLTSVPMRAVLCLGLLVGFGSAGTFAYWTDNATVTTGGFTSGSMDLRLDGSGATGLGTNYTKTSITWTGLAPNERKAFNLTVNNVGNPPFGWTATTTQAASPTWTFAANAITVQLFAGSAIADTTYPQQDTCSGAALGTVQTVDTTAKALTTAAQTLAAGGQSAICLVVGLDANADNANQGKTGAITVAFSAVQSAS